MTKIDPRQILQDGAADGQSLNWDETAGRWAPKTPSGGGGGGGAAWSQLGLITPTVGSSSAVTFTGIPDTCQDLLLVVDAINFASSTQLMLAAMFNGASSPTGSTTPVHSTASSLARVGSIYFPMPNNPVVTAFAAVTPGARAGEPSGGATTVGLAFVGTDRLTGLYLSAASFMNWSAGSFRLMGR